MLVDRTGPEDVAAWFDAASRDKPGAANRAFEILRSMMFRAEECGFRERGTNPCLGIRKNPRRNIARFLDTDELARLGRALDAHEAQWPEAVAAIRLLALTGCRRGEVLNLRWRDIGDNAIKLQDSKTGPRSVPLGERRAGNHCDVDTLPGWGRSPRRKRVHASRARSAWVLAALGNSERYPAATNDRRTLHDTEVANFNIHGHKLCLVRLRNLWERNISRRTSSPGSKQLFAIPTQHSGLQAVLDPQIGIF